MASVTDRTRRRLDISEASAVLARAPAMLQALLGGLPEAWLMAHDLRIISGRQG